MAVGPFALASCATSSRSGPGAGSARRASARIAATTTSYPTTTTTIATTTTTAPPPTTTTAPKPSAPAAAPGAAAPQTVQLPVPPGAVGSSGQVMTVIAQAYGDTVATFTAYQRTPNGWTQAFPSWTADIGYNGFAPPGQKREGDGRTPSGSYGFGFFFGVDADPGVQGEWRPVTSSSIVWDDDPASADYNQWVDESTQGAAAAGADPEPMYNTPAYDYGAVIAYNMNPVVPGDGSAIFLHVSTGGPTAGCVSLPMSDLLEVLRWMNPSEQPTIVMGTPSSL